MRIAIGLGASLGNRRRQLELALKRLAHGGGLVFERGSRWYHSPPMAGGAARNPFLNAVAVFRTNRSPSDVLVLCQRLEQVAGRRRARHWGDRPLDLDLLLAEGVCSDAPGLVLPHPAIRFRPFVLLPLLEVWPDAFDEREKRFYRDYPAAPGPKPWAVGIIAGR